MTLKPTFTNAGRDATRQVRQLTASAVVAMLLIVVLCAMLLLRSRAAAHRVALVAKDGGDLLHAAETAFAELEGRSRAYLEGRDPASSAADANGILTAIRNTNAQDLVQGRAEANVIAEAFRRIDPPLRDAKAVVQRCKVWRARRISADWWRQSEASRTRAALTDLRAAADSEMGRERLRHIARVREAGARSGESRPLGQRDPVLAFSELRRDLGELELTIEQLFVLDSSDRFNEFRENRLNIAFDHAAGAVDGVGSSVLKEKMTAVHLAVYGDDEDSGLYHALLTCRRLAEQEPRLQQTISQLFESARQSQTTVSAQLGRTFESEISATSGLLERSMLLALGVAALACSTFLLLGKRIGRHIADQIDQIEKSGRAVQAGEERLRLLIEHAPAAIAMFDRDMRYIAVSRRWLSDYKLDGRDIVGLSHYDVFKEIPENWKQIHQRCMAGAVERCDEDPFHRVDGDFQLLRWEVRPWFDAAGGIGGIVMLTEDITAAKQTERALREIEFSRKLIIDGAALGTWDWDIQSGTVNFNARWAEMLGYDATELRPHLSTWESLIHPEDKATMLAALRENIEGRADHFRCECRLRHKTGQWVWVLDCGQIVERDAQGNPMRAAGIHQDITDLKLTEANLQRARDQAEAASKAKSDFLANMSHEIRTPMTAIMGYSELLQDPNQGAEDRVNCVQTIRRNGEHLLSIINDILDISKIEAGRLRVERLVASPFALLEEIYSLMQVRAAAKGIELRLEQEFPLPSMIITDPTRLRQVLINLVGNAIKFTQSGSVVLSVSLPQMTHGEPRIRFGVRDTGIGITPEQVSRLFQPFSQADETTTRRFGGTGLGLTISQRLAQMLGGSISVKSEVGKGSVFSVSIATGSLEGVRMLSCADAPVPAAAKSDALNHIAPANLNILLCEDGPDNQRLIAFHLHKLGASVTLAENGRMGVEKCLAARDAGTPFDIVLMDMQMPELDGYSATQLLRAKQYLGPIIALTAHAMAGDRERCIGAGCDHYLTKPIDRNALMNALADWGAIRRTRVAA